VLDSFRHVEPGPLLNKARLLAHHQPHRQVKRPPPPPHCLGRRASAPGTRSVAPCAAAAAAAEAADASAAVFSAASARRLVCWCSVAAAGLLAHPVCRAAKGGVARADAAATAAARGPFGVSAPFVLRATAATAAAAEAAARARVADARVPTATARVQVNYRGHFTDFFAAAHTTFAPLVPLAAEPPRRTGVEDAGPLPLQLPS
jgi:hypothetical protein